VETVLSILVVLYIVVLVVGAIVVAYTAVLVVGAIVVVTVTVLLNAVVTGTVVVGINVVVLVVVAVAVVASTIALEGYTSVPLRIIQVVFFSLVAKIDDVSNGRIYRLESRFKACKCNILLFKHECAVDSLATLGIHFKTEDEAVHAEEDVVKTGSHSM